MLVVEVVCILQISYESQPEMHHRLTQSSKSAIWYLFLADQTCLNQFDILPMIIGVVGL